MTKSSTSKKDPKSKQPKPIPSSLEKTKTSEEDQPKTVVTPEPAIVAANKPKKSKKKLAIVLVAILAVIGIFSALDLGANNKDGVSFRTYKIVDEQKQYTDSFTKQDTVMIDVTFERPEDANYTINLKRKNSSQDFKIEVPAEDGKSRTVALPKSLTSSDSVDLELTQSTSHKLLQRIHLDIKN
jgi:hypothetical protein